MPRMTDTRRYSRLPFDSDTRLTAAENGHVQQTRLIDISLKGALVERPTFWQGAVGDRLLLEIRLNDSPVEIAMQTRVAHATGAGLGLECLAIDLDSMTHLRRLMELNMGDARLLERELLALG